MRTPAGAVFGYAYVCDAFALPGFDIGAFAIGSEFEELPPPPHAESAKNAAAANTMGARIAIALLQKFIAGQTHGVSVRFSRSC